MKYLVYIKKILQFKLKKSIIYFTINKWDLMFIYHFFDKGDKHIKGKIYLFCMIKRQNYS